MQEIFYAADAVECAIRLHHRVVEVFVDVAGRVAQYRVEHVVGRRHGVHERNRVILHFVTQLENSGSNEPSRTRVMRTATLEEAAFEECYQLLFEKVQGGQVEYAVQGWRQSRVFVFGNPLEKSLDNMALSVRRQK